jgi:ADP-heptose:LPS heptosyltransferase
MRLGAHGDILMATPALKAIREARPNAHITWIVERKERQAIDAHPYVDTILLWDSSYFKRMLRRVNWAGWAFEALRFRRRMRERKFDAFISYQPEEWPLLTIASGARTTVGIFDTFRQFNRGRRTSGYQRYYTHPFAHDRLPEHRTDQYLLALGPLGIEPPIDKRMSMGVTSEDLTAVEAFLSPKIQSSPFVILAPMTTWESRCWEPDRYAQLGTRLARNGYRTVIISSADEREKKVAGEIADKMDCDPVIAAGVFSFREMAALIGRADVLVSGDTGPMHVAAAMNTPFVSLFGPTPVAGRAPFSDRGISIMHPVPCGPCDQKLCPLAGPGRMACMSLITVDEVLESVLSLAAKFGRATA